MHPLTKTWTQGNRQLVECMEKSNMYSYPLQSKSISKWLWFYCQQLLIAYIFFGIVSITCAHETKNNRNQIEFYANEKYVTNKNECKLKWNEGMKPICEWNADKPSGFTFIRCTYRYVYVFSTISLSSSTIQSAITPECGDKLEYCGWKPGNEAENH